MSKNEITAKAQEIAATMKDLPILDRLLVFVTLTPDKELKAKFVQNYIQKHGPIPKEYADKIKKAMER